MVSRKDQMGKRNGSYDKGGIRSFCSQRSVFLCISPSSGQLHTCVHIWRTHGSPVIPKGPRMAHQHLPASSTQWMLNMHLLNEWTGWQRGPLGFSSLPTAKCSALPFTPESALILEGLISQKGPEWMEDQGTHGGAELVICVCPEHRSSGNFVWGNCDYHFRPPQC